jgi:hypothetical protein
MDRSNGRRRRGRGTIEDGLQILAAFDPERAGELEHELWCAASPGARLALRESLAEALFEHDQDEAAVEVLHA